MKNLNPGDVPALIEPWRVVAGYWTGKDYSEERCVVADLGEVEDGYVLHPRYVLIEHSHCSCYDFPDSEPWVTEYTEDELVRLAESKLEGGFYCKAERRFWQCVLLAFEKEHEE